MCDVGILTFHCADNFGAMLQAYGLKTYLRKKNIEADIVPYEPPFMTGRHWWIPYIPTGSIYKILRQSQTAWQRNLKLGKAFFEQRRNMRQFRDEYLIGKGEKRLFFSEQLRNLHYQYYIVGSDQIWNPDITLGLRKVYFGAFKNKNKRRVIAYAASLGKESLPVEYDMQFAKLIKSVDYISVREKNAIPYINKFYKGEVSSVPDPVFLLQREDWKKIEKVPNEEKYILVYMTERNEELIDYVKKLAKKEKLFIININGSIEFPGRNILIDHIAGPAECLGYIHKADYIVTNSFHGVAFSIIYKKKFIAFLHSSLGSRTGDLLDLCGLQCRLHKNNIDFQMETDIEWDIVERRIEEKVKTAENFLIQSLRK